MCRWCETERPIKYGFTALDLFQALPARCRRAAGAVSVHDREIEHALAERIFSFSDRLVSSAFFASWPILPGPWGLQFTQTRPPVTRGNTAHTHSCRKQIRDDSDEKFPRL